MENQSLNSDTPKIKLPDSDIILILGIISIVCFCCMYGLVGLSLGITSLVLSTKSKNLYLNSPTLYTKGSYQNLKAGRTCAIIGLCLSGIFILSGLIAFFFFGALISGMFSAFPWEELLDQVK